MADTVREVMTTDAIAVNADTSIAQAAQLMRDRGVGDVLVTRGGAVLGIVTDRDITIRATADGLDPVTTTVDACASGDLAVVDAGASAGEVVRLFRDRAIRRAPVVDDGMVVGVVSLGDLARERDSDSALAHISAAPANR